MSLSVAEQIIAEVFASLGDEVSKAIGRREVAAHARAPRVVAIPVGAQSITQPDQPGGQTFTGEDGIPYKMRRLLLRNFVIEWECHGASPDPQQRSFGAAEELYLDVVRAIREACHHSVEFSNERWIDQEEGADSYDHYGTVIAFITTIQIPVWDRKLPLVTPTGITTTFELNDEPFEG